MGSLLRISTKKRKKRYYQRIFQLSNPLLLGEIILDNGKIIPDKEELVVDKEKHIFIPKNRRFLPEIGGRFGKPLSINQEDPPRGGGKQFQLSSSFSLYFC